MNQEALTLDQIDKEINRQIVFLDKRGKWFILTEKRVEVDSDIYEVLEKNNLLDSYDVPIVRTNPAIAPILIRYKATIRNSV